MVPTVITRRLNLSDFSKKCAYGTPELGAGLATGGYPGGPPVRVVLCRTLSLPQERPKLLGAHLKCSVDAPIYEILPPAERRTRSSTNLSISSPEAQAAASSIRTAHTASPAAELHWRATTFAPP